MTEEEIISAIQQVVGLAGMTVNERLSACGLFKEFDSSMKHDKEKARKILQMLQVDRTSIEKIIS